MRLKLASRKSDLARWQAVQVARTLEKIPDRPSIEFLFKASLGDQNLDLPLASMGSKGVFTEDFYRDLVDGQCDLVVHSWKDLPVEPRVETQIAMTLPRADVRDILLLTEETWARAQKTGVLKIFTSSPRRVYNLNPILASLLPGKVEIEFVPVRGNVPTRLKRMREDGHGLLLAKAGLDRLLAAESEGFLQNEVSVKSLTEDCRFMVLPISINPPAPAQGALAVEIAAGNEFLSQVCQTLNHPSTFESALREREILHGYGGGCHQKIGVAVVEKPYGTVFALRGLTDAGEVLNQWRLENSTPWTRADHAERVFPLEPKQNSWFERVSLTVETAILTAKPALLVARADAWPEGYEAPKSQVIWTAGVTSWQRLARQGVWVNGCSDGLGDDEKDWTWCKLTHRQAAAPGDLATYELKPGQNPPDLRGKTHFFWMSGTSFERARQLFPREINEGYHACGPGQTWQFLKSVKGLAQPVKVFIGLEQFLRETLP